MLMNVELWFREFIDAQPRQESSARRFDLISV
jgi:hypothetical protein